MTRTELLPPVPLTDDVLEQLAEREEIREVWVPEGRPNSIRTRAGVHTGDILAFWIETGDCYVKFEYTSEDGRGLAWHRKQPTQKDEYVSEAVERDLADGYQPLREGSA